MRIDPITKESFEPINPNHFFISKESYLAYLDKIDPVSEFQPVKREINWSPQKRIDPRTGEKFLAEHPAQIYAPNQSDES